MADEINDEDMEFLNGIPWQYHPAREFLLEKLRLGDFPADYKRMRPFDVWNKYCDDDVFEGMEYDSKFTARLLRLRTQFNKGKDRADEDLLAFNLAKANHPPPPGNHRDEPQWNGSEAQRLLRLDMDDKKHFDLKPSDLWESRDEYQLFYLETFRDHIHQEDQTRKYLHTLKLRQKEEAEKHREKGKKKAARDAALEKKWKAKEAKAKEAKAKAKGANK